MFGAEQATQRGQRQARFAGGQGAEGDLQRGVKIRVRIVGAVAHGALAQAAQAVAAFVECLGGRVAARRVQQIAFFHGEQEDQPVNQAQQFLKVAGPRECAGRERGAQGIVGGFGESLAKLAQLRSTPRRSSSRARMPVCWPSLRQISSGQSAGLRCA